MLVLLRYNWNLLVLLWIAQFLLSHQSPPAPPTLPLGFFDIYALPRASVWFLQFRRYHIAADSLCFICRICTCVANQTMHVRALPQVHCGMLSPGC